MLTADELESLTTFLAGTPARVRALVQNLSERDARLKPSAQEFSALEHACHLNDLEREGYGARIEKLIHEEHPFLPDFDGGRIAAERDYNNQHLETALDAFMHSRHGNLRAIAHLSTHDLQRSGTLETVGPITLETLLLKMREHDEAHLQELNTLCGQLSGR
jgi:hypothetical protein